MSLVEDVERLRTDIVTDTYSTTWREVIGQFKDQELRIDPEYQRLFRWDLDQQSQYIESLLLNIPSPPLFLARNKDGGFEVLDGLQRVSTLIRFFSRELFSESVLEVTADNQEEYRNVLEAPLVLTEPPIISSLSGFTAITLPEALVRTVRYARITIILVEKESTPRARYEVFKRLNKQAAVLSDQEIRNCSARSFGTEFPTQLRVLASEDCIRQALSLSAEEERRMGVEEKVLRMLAFNHGEEAFKHEVSEYLDSFMVFAAEGKFQLTEDIKGRIKRTFSLIFEAKPDGSAFRFARGGFSTNLFDVVATGVYKNIDTLSAQSFGQRLVSLIDSDELKPLVGAGSNTRKKMQGRVSLGEAWFRS